MRPWNGLLFKHGVDTTNLVCIGVMRSPSDQPPAVTNRTPPSAESDYESIHAAVMETVRGRWFLSEYARRNRHADTDVLLKAIGRIESFIEDQVQEKIQDLGPAPMPIENNDNRPASSDEAPAAASFLAPQDKLEAVNAELVLVREHIRNIADSLVECGSPSFLTNDLKRRLADLSRICTQLGDIAKGAQPAADDVVALAEDAPAQDGLVHETLFEEDTAQAVSIQEDSVQESPVLETEASALPDETSDLVVTSDVVIVSGPEAKAPRDPFADIRALSAIEKIALFT